MSRENYIKMLIKSEDLTIKDFAQKINMPYTTLLSILNGSLGGASVDNVMKICEGLHITIEELQQNFNAADSNASLEAELIKLFRTLNSDNKNIAIVQIKALSEYQNSK
ncbi:helix-turn-helix transcriptional regulator [Clostridium sp.]|uniref:helix-turn-helix domain-containing protein n=1 Tax=Clostridium sp. TaxID=1506 RepID=UPI002618CD55|nr:helix-turn-helix transcriptional regulator [Clostridium sp.]